jgi:hypothetical protein
MYRAKFYPDLISDLAFQGFLRDSFQAKKVLRLRPLSPRYTFGPPTPALVWRAQGGGLTLVL